MVKSFDEARLLAYFLYVGKLERRNVEQLFASVNGVSRFDQDSASDLVKVWQKFNNASDQFSFVQVSLV